MRFTEALTRANEGKLIRYAYWNDPHLAVCRLDSPYLSHEWSLNEHHLDDDNLAYVVYSQSLDEWLYREPFVIKCSELDGHWNEIKTKNISL